MPSRLEFRVFDGDLAAVGRALRRGFGPPRRDRHGDLYLIGPDPARSWKLRDARRLDLKCRVERDGAFDRWAAAGGIDLPAAGAAILAAFDGAADLPPIDPRARHDAHAICAAFVAAGARAVPVGKLRERYDTAAGRAEFTRVAGGRGRLHSVAIEGPDRDELEDLRRRLGLGARINLGYSDWLARPALPPPAAHDRPVPPLAAHDPPVPPPAAQDRSLPPPAAAHAPSSRDR